MHMANKTTTYKGREYELLWEGKTKFGRRAKLGFLDGSKEFWVDADTLGGIAAPAKGKAPPYSRQSTKGRTGGGGRRPPKSAGVLKEGGGVKAFSYQRVPEGADATAQIGRTYRNGTGGDIVTVVGAESWYVSDEANEDMGDMRGGGWSQTRYVRPATPEEASPILKAEKEKQTAAEKDKRFDAIIREVKERGGGALDQANAEYRGDPPGMVLDKRFVNAAGSSGDALGVEGTSLVVHMDTGYDDYRGFEWRVDDGALADEVRALTGKQGIQAEPQKAELLKAAAPPPEVLKAEPKPETLDVDKATLRRRVATVDITKGESRAPMQDARKQAGKTIPYPIPVDRAADYHAWVDNPGKSDIQGIDTPEAIGVKTPKPKRPPKPKLPRRTVRK